MLVFTPIFSYLDKAIKGWESCDCANSYKAESRDCSRPKMGKKALVKYVMTRAFFIGQSGLNVQELLKKTANYRLAYKIPLGALREGLRSN